MSQELSTNDCCSTILEEIKQFSEHEAVSKCITLEGLNSKERAQIYDVLEKNYHRLLEFERQTSYHGNDKRVVLILRRITGEKQTKMVRLEITDIIVHTFRKYTKLPLPLTKHQFVNYYLDCLDPYTSCRAIFSQFLQDIETHETVFKLNSRIEQVINSIITYIKEHPSVQTFKDAVFEQEMKLLKSSPYKIHCELYKKENQDRLFISVDIVKADFNIIKYYHPEVFHHLSTWEEFVVSFLGEKPINTLKSSKSIRERIFGLVKLGNKTNSLAEYFIHKILHEMNISPANVITIATDEVVLSYDQSTFRRLFDRYHGNFFKVQAFRLVKLPKYDYFVKEHFHPVEGIDNQQIEVTRREFKCVPLNFIMQCIKQYEGQPILEIDRKFSIDSDQVATFDEPIF